jgi:hypothetical protein
MENIRKDLKNTVYALLIAGMVGGVSACGTERKADDATNTGRAYEKENSTLESDAETTEMGENAWMRERNDYVTKHRERIDEIDRTIEERERQMKTMSGKAKSKMNEGINSLKMKRDRFDSRLNELEQSTEENWTRMRNELDESATELDRTFDTFEKEYEN